MGLAVGVRVALDSDSTCFSLHAGFSLEGLFMEVDSTFHPSLPWARIFECVVLTRGAV